MQTADVVIRLAAEGGKFETVGVDRLRGITPDPDSVMIDADEWGPRSCAFTLRRDPKAIHPDLSAFTPGTIDIAGVRVFSGRVRETPSRDGDDRQITVQGEGWQYHLDDDTYRWPYVHTSTTDYRDCATRSDATLGQANLFAAASVRTDDGVITLAFPNATAVVAGAHCGVFLDLGVDGAAKRVVLVWESSNNTSALTLYCRGSNVSGDPITAGNADFENAFTIVNNSAASGTTAGTFATARRYVQFFLFNAAFNGTTGADHYFKLKAIRVFAATAYESGNASILKASDVVKDARGQATALISTSDAKVTASTFSIPEFVVDGDNTPRSVIEAVNAYHDNQTAVDVDRRLVFGAKPSRPTLEVGDWSGAEFSDASMNSGQEIYNRVIVQGEGPDGAPMRVERYTAALSSVSGELISTPSNPTPSFATNTTGWTTDATLTRDTVTFDTSPASGRVDVTPADSYFVASPAYSGTFLRGHTYKLTVWLAHNFITADISGPIKLTFGEGVDASTLLIPFESFPASATHTIAWTPTSDRTAAALRVDFTTTGTPGSVWIDSLTLYEVRNATMIDRRGFRRTKILPVRSALTAGMANQIGDTFLRGHKTTPFKGDLSVTGQGGIRRALGGQPVHPAHLLLEYGQLIRFCDRVDPDTGAWGRQGRIAAVSYKHADQSAAVSIDSTSRNFENLLARLDVVTGQVR